MVPNMTTVVLGTEFDLILRQRVRAALKKLGAQRVDARWGIAGSQEVGIERWQTDEAQLVLEAETYIGLSLSGPPELVTAVALDIQG